MSEEDPSTVAFRVPLLNEPGETGPSALCLTIVWHPEPLRVGEAAQLGAGTFDVSRKTPPFDPGTDVLLSRAPFLSVTDRGGDIELRPHEGGSVVELDGQALGGALLLPEERLRGGVILSVARAVVVCLHRARVPVLRGPDLGIVGGGDAIEVVRRQIAKVADLNVPVLIRGETGTGKEMVARAVFAGSNRAAGPFVDINMATIPSSTAADELFGHEKGAFTGASESRPGCFVEADGGTLFLDEIAATPADVQKMLLRVLETGEIRPLGARRARAVNVRILAATDANLEEAVKEGKFDEPLLHRLAGYQIHLPTLRDRREDIGPLFLHFLRAQLAAVGERDRLDPRDPTERPWLGAPAVARIAAAPLAGNVRQLRNLARQLVISSRGQRFAEIDATVEAMLIAAGDVSEHEHAVPSRTAKVTNKEIQAALRTHNYNFSAAAQALGIHRSTLYDRVRENPGQVRNASDLTDDEVLRAHDRHQGDVAAMAAELHVSPKPLKARVTEALTRRSA